MKSKKWLYLAIFIIILIISWVAIYLWAKKDSSLSSGKWIESWTNSSKKEYFHINPTKISKNDYFKWEFISNDVVSVYPRRDGLVKDILVDIWDEIKVWETLAILFNPGVEWESNSKINIKSTILSTKNKILQESIEVKNAKISEIEQKIYEKEIVLEETINNFDNKIAQVWDFETLWSEYQVQLKSLENLKVNFNNAELLKEELLSESKNNIVQKEILLDAKINEVYNKIIPILYIWNEIDTDYNNINSSDFSEYFWAKNTTFTNIFITKIKKYHNTKSNLSINENYNLLYEISNDLITVLQNTITSVEISESSIVSHISNINSLKSWLISQKEILDDVINMHKVLWVTQNEKIQNIEVQITKKENELALLNTKNNSIWADKNLSVSKMKAEIDTLIKSKELLIANENKNIVSIENDISIAKADLNNESIKSGDYKIISPFSWIISKRWIKIWEKISSNNEVFRLTDVETTLSRITKKEVKFFVPETLKENIIQWKEISFSLWSNESKTFTGQIYRISPEIDFNNSSIIVQAKVDDTISLPNNSTLRVRLETQEKLFKIPSATIYNKEERKIIYYKKENGKLWVRDINIISEDWEYSLVTGNIDENLQVVTTPIFIK